MTTDKRILIADGDVTLQRQLMLHGGFRVTEAGDGGAALARAKRDHFSLIVLEAELPDMDGREVCRAMRRSGVTAPILILTHLDSEADVIWGLDAGADDYIVKPVRFGVLLARFRAQIRVYERSGDAQFVVGPYTFQPANRLLLSGDGDRRIRLAEKETEILKFLSRTGGRTVSRDVLRSEIWGYAPDINTNTLETHTYRLRQKIEPDPKNPSILITERGGYRLAS